MDKLNIFFNKGLPFEIKNIKPLNGLAGLYFIYNKEISINYPFDTSKLIYIGMSEKRTNSIGKRLQGHLEGTSKNDGLVNYNKANPVMFTYINFEMLRSKWPYKVEQLESYFILDFVKKYGVYPICNNKSGYDILDMGINISIEIDWENFK